MQQYWFDYLNQALILGILAMSVNIVMGYTGIFSIANAALAGIAGYLAAYLSATQGWDFLPCLLVGMAAAAVVGALLTFPVLRLSSDYVILLTLAFATVIVSAIVAVPQFGGPNGLLGIKPVDLGGELVRPNDF